LDLLRALQHQDRTNVSLAVFGATILGFSSMFTGINFITTIHRCAHRA